MAHPAPKVSNYNFSYLIVSVPGPSHICASLSVSVCVCLSISVCLCVSCVSCVCVSINLCVSVYGHVYVYVYVFVRVWWWCELIRRLTFSWFGGSIDCLRCCLSVQFGPSFDLSRKSILRRCICAFSESCHVVGGLHETMDVSAFTRTARNTTLHHPSTHSDDDNDPIHSKSLVCIFFSVYVEVLFSI